MDIRSPYFSSNISPHQLLKHCTTKSKDGFGGLAAASDKYYTSESHTICKKGESRRGKRLVNPLTLRIPDHGGLQLG